MPYSCILFKALLNHFTYMTLNENKRFCQFFEASATDNQSLPVTQ